ncbi:MAG: PTS sugar transporter subunit IIA [Deltaproteobacteria bacterium]|jgi:PTS system nitrogen regulatory IIA component|nr:PTS sugar transporter subunit IIA [Deltaproteobacteria bacterium]
MDLGKILSLESVWLDFAPEDKQQAIVELSRFAAERLGLDPSAVADVVLGREQLGSTALGGGVALPHGKTPMLGEAALFLARTASGLNLDFDSPDGRPVRLLALLLSPQRPSPEHLKVLSALGRIWKAPENVSALLTAPDCQSFLDVFLLLAGEEPASAS